MTVRLYGRAGWLALAVVWGASAPVRAQAPTDSVTLSPVVITATKLAVPRSALPSSVTVLDGEALRDRGITHLLDALRGAPGTGVVQTGSFGGNTSVFLRGGESDYVKVLVDGVPVNEPGGAFDFANLTLDNVERIELVRGPTSVLYGSDAVSGVLHIITRGGAGRPRGEAGLRAGTYGSVVANAGAWGTLGRTRFSFGISGHTTGGIHEFNNRYRNAVVSGSVHVNADVRTDVAVDVRYTDAVHHFPTDGAGQVVDRNALREQDLFSGALTLRRQVTDWLRGHLEIMLSRDDGGIDDRPDGPADTLGFFGFQSDVTTARRSVELRADVTLPLGATLTGGVQLEGQSQLNLSESQSAFGAFRDSLDATRANGGVFAQLFSGDERAWAVTAGVRVDDNETFGTFVTHRSGVSVRSDGGTKLRASVGTAFKEPTFFENFATSPFALGNPDLRPERSTSWEVGVEQVLLAGRSRVAATYFYQRFRDLIQYSAAPAAGDPNYVNVAAADASGLELEGAAAAGPVALAGAYTLLFTDVVDAGLDADGAAFVEGQRLLRRPQHTLSVTGTFRSGDLGSVALTVMHVGTRDDRDFSAFPARAVTLPAYTTVNAAGHVTLVGQGRSGPTVSFTVSADNLFNARYSEVFGFPSRRRTILLGARAGF